MLKENSEFTKIYESFSWRYFLFNVRIGAIFTFVLNLFFIFIAFITSTWFYVIIGIFFSSPIIITAAYYVNRLQFLKRNMHNFIYETVVFPAPVRRGKKYTFNVAALDSYGRVEKTTRSIFNALPTHFLYFAKFAHKEVEIMHLEGKRRIYVVNVKEAQFWNN